MFPCTPSSSGPPALSLDLVISSSHVFKVPFPPIPLLLRVRSLFFLRFRTPGTVGNPCSRTSCFFSPRFSLVAPPERLSPVRPIFGLDSPYGRVSNDRVPRHPTPSTRQTAFHPFSRWFAISQSSASSRPRCRWHEHAVLHTARMLHSPPPPFSLEFVFLRYVATEYPYIRAITHSSLISPQTPHARDLSGISLLCPRTLTSA